MEENQSIHETLAGFKETLTAQNCNNFLASATRDGECVFAFNGNIKKLLSDSMQYLHSKDPEMAKNAVLCLIEFASQWYQLNVNDSKVLH